MEFLRAKGGMPTVAALLFIAIACANVCPLAAQDHGHDHDRGKGCVVEPEHRVDPAVVVAMRRSGEEKGAVGVQALPALTVASVVGKTVVAVFYMDVDEGTNLAPYWEPALHAQVSANIRANLDWWQDVAASYGAEADLQVVEYYDTPLTMLDRDPTRDNAPGGFLNDRSLYDTVMNRLGYTLGNSTEKMTAFCLDLAAEKGADQACIVWLITGRNMIRSNATFNGPYTNIWFRAAQSGWTTAHEMGHIFGAFDEYYEEGTEYTRSRQSRNGAPNDNLAFRNHPVIPCMMATSHNEGICSYTAVHVGLTDTVRFTRVEPEQPLGIYEVRYWDPEEGAFGETAYRYQGRTTFPWGAGLRAQLSGLDNVPDEDFTLLSGARWPESGSPVLDFTADTAELRTLTMGYDGSEGKGDYRIEYLAADEGPLGAYVYGVLPLGNRRAAIAGRDGICIYDEALDSLRIVLDYPFADSRDGSPRRGYSLASGPDGTIWFGTQKGELVRWNGDTASRLVAPSRDAIFRSVAVTPDGDVWAGHDGGMFRFRGGGDAQVTSYTSARDPLIGETVWCLAADSRGGLWIGSRGRRDQGSGGGGLQRYDPATDIWSDYTGEIGGGTVNSVAVWGDTVAVAASDGFALFDGNVWTRYEPGNDFHPMVTMVGRDAFGRLLAAGFGGLARLTDGGIWERFTLTNSLLPASFITSLALGPDGTVWAGTTDGSVALINFADDVSSVVGRIDLSASAALQVAPNPARDVIAGTFRISAPGRVALALYDAAGRERGKTGPMQREAGRHAFAIPAEGLEMGHYWLVLNAGGKTVTAEVVVGEKE